MARKLFVGGLSWDTDSASIEAAFARFGAVSEAVVITDRETGRSRGFGFVAFANDADADAAIAAMNEGTLDGRMIRVHEASERGAAPRPGGDDRGGPRPPSADRGPPRPSGDRGAPPRPTGDRGAPPRPTGDRGAPMRPPADRGNDRAAFGGSRGGWDMAPPDDFGGGKRDRPSRAERGGGRERDRHDLTWTAHERPSRVRPRPNNRDDFDDE